MTISENSWKEFTGYAGSAFGKTLSEKNIQSFKTHVNELIEWNKKFNLVSFKTEEELLWRHIADSLSPLKFIKPAAMKAIDLGAGAGLPGIPLKIALPDMQLSLVESIAKKCSFMEHIKTTLGFTGFEVLNARAEELGQDKAHREQYDVAFSRAFTSLSANLELTLPFLKQGGSFYLFKTPEQSEEIKHSDLIKSVIVTLGGELNDVFCYTIPVTGSKFCLLKINKVKASPKEYPRRTGVPEKRPLF